MTENLSKEITSSIKKYGLDNLRLAIDNYSEVYYSEYYYKHIWKLDKFLKQGNGVPEFLEDGQMWVNYKSDTAKNKPDRKVADF